MRVILTGHSAGPYWTVGKRKFKSLQKALDFLHSRKRKTTKGKTTKATK